MAESRERARERKEGDDRWGRRVSERENARADGPRVAGPRGRDAAGLRGWAEPEGERRKRPDRSFSFSKM
jgi:hypothetical protein